MQVPSPVQEVGLRPDVVQAWTGAGEFRAGTLGRHQEALQRGVTGIPTFVLEDRMADLGVQPADVFRRIITEKNLTKDSRIVGSAQLPLDRTFDSPWGLCDTGHRAQYEHLNMLSLKKRR